MDINQAFGKALREIRISKGLSQEKMASAASRVYISSLERGLKSPTLITVEMIARELGVHPLTLLTLTYQFLESADLDVVTKELKNIT
jgi:transcriptional regulator with XRE-family HTH domain